MWTTGTFSVVEFSENYLQTHHRIDHHSVKRSSSDCDLEVKKVSTPAFPQVHCVSCLCGPVDWRHYPLHDPYCQREYMAYGTFPLPGLSSKWISDWEKFKTKMRDRKDLINVWSIYYMYNIWFKVHFDQEYLVIWWEINFFDTKYFMARYGGTFELPNHHNLQKW